MECSRCLLTSDVVKILPSGECEYCGIHDELEKQSNPYDLHKVLNKIRKSNGEYDCLIGISGGLDSSVLLYTAVRWWGLKPLVIHFDNGWNNTQAENNMIQLVQKLGVNSITYRLNKREYDLLNDSFLAAGLPDADIPNDIAMTKLMYQTADQYKIKYILNGHDFRTEGSTPAKWTYMDAKYISSVYEWFTSKKLVDYPLFTFKDQIIYALKGIKQVRPFHYGFDRLTAEKEMKEFINWQDYGGKHCENIYTEFVGAALLPLKFGIDKRIVYLSAQVRSGKITRNHAKNMFDEKPVFDFKKLGIREVDIMHLMSSQIQPRTNFKKYNFKRYKFIIWLLAKCKVVPQTFYIKYAK